MVVVIVGDQKVIVDIDEQLKRLSASVMTDIDTITLEQKRGETIIPDIAGNIRSETDRNEAELRSWILQAQSGDARAMEELISRVHEQVLRLCRNVLGDYHQAEDSSQEALMKMVQKLYQFNPRRSFKPWLYQIALNTCRDQLRQQKRRPSRPLDENQPPMLSMNSDSSVEERLVRADEKKRLAAAIARLAPRQRMALVLRDVEELPTEEVARILGLSRITVRVHIRAARLKLRELLQTAEGGVHELPTS